MDLFHKPLKNGGWQVVRCKMYTVADAVQRLNFLANKARKMNANLDLWQATPQIGKVGIAERDNILIDYLEPTDHRLRVGIYDCIREFLLVAILFRIADSEKVAGNLLLK